MSAETPAERRAALTRLSQELTDQGKLIEAGWVGLQLAAMPAGAPRDQLTDMRMAFFAGAQHLFTSIMTILDPGAEPTDADLLRMDLINAELESFAKQLSRHLGSRARD